MATSLGMLALIVPRAVVVLMRSVAARVAYADSSVRTFARRMAGRTACAAHSIRTFAALLAIAQIAIAVYKSWRNLFGWFDASQIRSTHPNACTMVLYLDAGFP